MTRRTAGAAVLSAALLVSATSCDSIDLGSLAAFLGPGLTVVIENDTDFTAAADLRSSDSRNIAEDLVSEDNQIQSFGMNGAVGPHQTVTARLTCDGDLERIAFAGADFREGNGFAVGDLNHRVTLRRDTDFDCGDTIRITLSGEIFRFSAEVTVEQSTDDGGWLFGGDQAGSAAQNDNADTDSNTSNGTAGNGGNASHNNTGSNGTGSNNAGGTSNANGDEDMADMLDRLFD